MNTSAHRPSGSAVAYQDAPIRGFHLRVTIAGTGGQFSDGGPTQSLILRLLLGVVLAAGYVFRYLVGFLLS